ncbi:MAG: phage tail sheath family protein [Oscillospiraceae bacterium]
MYKHGVYNREQPTSLTTPIVGTAGLQIVFGVAPIHLSADPMAAVNTPVLCYSFAECQKALGYSDDFANFTLCQSMDASFRVFNVAPIVLVNVLDPSKAAHTTVNAAESCPVTAGQITYGKPFVMLPTLLVKNLDKTLVAGSDYIAAHDETGKTVITLLSTAAKEAATLTVSSTSINPAGVTKEDIVGGVNVANGKETGLELVRAIYPKLGLVPGILLAPGWSQDPVVAAALQAKTEAINGSYDCCCYLDIPTDAAGAGVYTAVKGAKEKLGAGGTHAVALWPMVAVGAKKYYFSAMFAALTAYTDAENGDVPHESPSNKALRVTATVLADGTEVALDQEQGNLLNGWGVITAINADGFKSWGNNTAAYPTTTDPKDRWLAVRRFFDWDGNNFIRTYFQKVDRPGNRRLIQSIADSQNIVGNGYVAREYCAGYRVEFREDENPVTNLLAGHLTTRTYLAPYIPAEQIENIREYDVGALQAAMGGK